MRGEVVGSSSSSRAEVPSEEPSEVASLEALSVEGGERRGGGEEGEVGGGGREVDLEVRRGMRGGGDSGREVGGEPARRRDAEEGLLDRESGGEWEEDRDEGWPGMEVAEARRG